MVPLEVTHSILVTDDILEKIKNIQNWTGHLENLQEMEQNDQNTLPPHPHIEYDEIWTRVQATRLENRENPSDPPLLQIECPEASPFANCCFQLLSFFKKTYKECFSFQSPPLHDPATVFYLTHPQAFDTLPLFVDIEITSEKCLGRTLCDLHDILKKEPNVLVCTRITNVNLFWTRLLNCIQLADSQSPLNSLKSQ